MIKILLVGNYPPPYGGISVHISMLHRLLEAQGVDCQVLNIDPDAPISEQYIRVNGYSNFLMRLINTSRARIVHLHTNGHNIKSWLVALICGWVGHLIGRGAILTIHSGLAPAYLLEGSSGLGRLLIKTALRSQSYVICVNAQIRAALTVSGFPCRQTILIPAFLFDENVVSRLDKELCEQLSRFHPLLSLVAFFRPEYGVELLIEALAKLSENFPRIGCAIMGSGEDEARLRQLAIQHGVAARLLWLGDLEHGQCLSVIKSSQLFVRPTLADGDSISVREALQLSVPIVASDVGYRPCGITLFRAGDVSDLIAKCAYVLMHRQAPSSTSTISDLSTLLTCYQQIYSAQTIPSQEGQYEQNSPTTR
ncbi:MAG: glycosyltransferase [Acidobacteriota bacterium]